MPSYAFLTTWLLDSPIAPVWAAIHDQQRWPATTKAWMNLLAPVARPVFEWNHDWVMARGGEGIARRLGCDLFASG